MNSLIILSTDTQEEKKGKIVTLTSRININTKTSRSFDMLFGTQLPHDSVERILRFNSRVLTDDIKRSLFKILTADPSNFYRDPDLIESHKLRTAGNWDDGVLLSNWRQFTKNPNPHHIVPESRGGTNNSLNIRFIDRNSHNYFHTVFTNLTPIEQVIVLLQYYKNIFHGDLTSEIRKTLYKRYPEPESYRNGVVSRNKLNLFEP